MKSSLDRVRRNAADVFGVDLESVSSESSPETIEQWDSVQHLNLMLEVESAFGVAFSPEDMANIHSIGDLAAFVDRTAPK